MYIVFSGKEYVFFGQLARNMYIVKNAESNKGSTLESCTCDT